MTIIKKAPEIIVREIDLEQPVIELLEDYARFIESSPDYVVNSALKKVLWRDQDYRKWRSDRHNAHPGLDEAQPVVKQAKEARG